MILFLALLSSALAFWCYFLCADLRNERRRSAQANAAIEHLHAALSSARNGHPLVKWTHPSPTPASDKWYWRARFSGVNHLFTEEAMADAKRRAELLLHHA